MSSTNDLAVKLAVIKAIMDAAKQAEASTKGALTSALDPGDRKMARHGGADLGTVSYAKTSTTAAVTDRAAFTNWVRENHPSEMVEARVPVRQADLEIVTGVRQVVPADEYKEAHDRLVLAAERFVAPEVRSSYVDHLCALAIKNGTPVDPDTGEVVPGITVTPGGEGKYVSIRQTDDQRQNVLDAYAAGDLDLLDLATTPAELQAATDE